jgi:hypothetical protein
VKVYYIINFASCAKKKIRLSQKGVERSPLSETSRRIVAVREAFVRNQWFLPRHGRLKTVYCLSAKGVTTP